MKRCIMLLSALQYLSCFSQGTACSNAITIPLDGNIVTQTASSSTGTNVICTGASTSPITWFQFTTNATGQCPLLSISASDAQACEIALYTSCSGNMNNNLESPSSMCFYDGAGLWAPSETLNLSPSTTYYLRIKTSTACDISIGGLQASPVNDDCDGALSIGTIAITDNNACHQPGPNVTFTQLCASSLENTAFYQYYVATTGTSIINISNISCDNGANNVNNGFQIGFFKGSCTNLTWLSCSSGSGSFVQATTPSLDAGTKVFVAVDGMDGSNCRYSIEAQNAYMLATELKNFSVWKKNGSNILKWTGMPSKANYFSVERSVDGHQFSSIGKITVSDFLEKDYSFEDRNPIEKAWYRVRQQLQNGISTFTHPLLIKRDDLDREVLRYSLTPTKLNVQLRSDNEQTVQLTIVNASGQWLVNKNINCKKGTNDFTYSISSWSSGCYYLIATSKTGKLTMRFVKSSYGYQ